MTQNNKKMIRLLVSVLMVLMVLMMSVPSFALDEPAGSPAGEPVAETAQDGGNGESGMQNGEPQDSGEDLNSVERQAPSEDPAPAANTGAPLKANSAEANDAESNEDPEPVTYSGYLYGRHIGWDLNYPGTRPKAIDELKLKYSITSPLEQYALAFEDVDGRTGVFKASADSMRGAQTVTNKASGIDMVIAGFVPFHFTYSFDLNESPAKPYYSFTSKADAEAYVRAHQGVLYGEAPTEELLTAEKGRIITIWYQKNTLPEGDHYPKVTGSVEPITDRIAPVYEETTDVVKKSVEIKETNQGAQVILTAEIPETANVDEINIDMLDFDVPNISGLQPGDSVEYIFNVIDHSGKYTYKEKSGSLGTLPLQAAEGQKSFSGFEKYAVPLDKEDLSFFATRCLNKPLKDLIQTDYPASWWRNWGDQLDYFFYLVGGRNKVKGFEAIIGDSLLSQGYGDPEDYKTDGNDYDYESVINDWLDVYYLDWYSYNYGDGEPYTSFNQLSKTALSILFEGEVNLQAPETNTNVANALYYAFYENGYPADGKGVYSWMAKPEGYGEADGNLYDQHLLDQWNDASRTTTEGKTVTHRLGHTHKIDGEFNSNAMEDTKFGTLIQFRLVKNTQDLLITKSFDDYGMLAESGDPVNAAIAFKIIGKDEDGTQIYENHAGLVYTGGEEDPTVLIEGIPVCAEIIVTEEYSGNYTPDKTSQSVSAGEITYNEEENRWEVTFENKQTGITYSSGVVNKYQHVKGKDGEKDSIEVRQEGLSEEDSKEKA